MVACGETSTRKTEMNRSQKALVTKELQKASASLSNAFQLVARDDGSDKELKKKLRDHQKAVGELIISFNGGPVISIAELVH
jgi:hypothetical protein